MGSTVISIVAIGSALISVLTPPILDKINKTNPNPASALTSFQSVAKDVGTTVTDYYNSTNDYYRSFKFTRQLSPTASLNLSLLDNSISPTTLQYYRSALASVGHYSDELVDISSGNDDTSVQKNACIIGDTLIESYNAFMQSQASNKLKEVDTNLLNLQSKQATLNAELASASSPSALQNLHKEKVNVDSQIAELTTVKSTYEQFQNGQLNFGQTINAPQFNNKCHPGQTPIATLNTLPANFRVQSNIATSLANTLEIAVAIKNSQSRKKVNAELAKRILDKDQFVKDLLTQIKTNLDTTLGQLDSLYLDQYIYNKMQCKSLAFNTEIPEAKTDFILQEYDSRFPQKNTYSCNVFGYYSAIEQDDKSISEKRKLKEEFLERVMNEKNKKSIRFNGIKYNIQNPQLILSPEKYISDNMQPSDFDFMMDSWHIIYNSGSTNCDLTANKNECYKTALKSESDDLERVSKIRSFIRQNNPSILIDILEASQGALLTYANSNKKEADVKKLQQYLDDEKNALSLSKGNINQLHDFTKITN